MKSSHVRIKEENEYIFISGNWNIGHTGKTRGEERKENSQSSHEYLSAKLSRKVDDPYDLSPADERNLLAEFGILITKVSK
jgi:hypothetical protein